MKEPAIQKLMSEALDKYGELLIAQRGKEKILKESVCASYAADNVSCLKVRENIMANGELLEENEEKQSFVAVVKTGAMGAASAFVVVLIDNKVIEVMAYAKEGLIKQNLAKRAIEKVLAR